MGSGVTDRARCGARLRVVTGVTRQHERLRLVWARKSGRACDALQRRCLAEFTVAARLRRTVVAQTTEPCGALRARALATKGVRAWWALARRSLACGEAERPCRTVAAGRVALERVGAVLACCDPRRVCGARAAVPGSTGDAARGVATAVCAGATLNGGAGCGGTRIARRAGRAHGNTFLAVAAAGTGHGSGGWRGAGEAGGAQLAAHAVLAHHLSVDALDGIEGGRRAAVVCWAWQARQGGGVGGVSSRCKPNRCPEVDECARAASNNKSNNKSNSKSNGTQAHAHGEKHMRAKPCTQKAVMSEKRFVPCGGGQAAVENTTQHTGAAVAGCMAPLTRARKRAFVWCRAEEAPTTGLACRLPLGADVTVWAPRGRCGGGRTRVTRGARRA